MYLFNPDNDLALANFSPHYTPPASAAKMAEELAILPVWYAPDGEKIVANAERDKRFLAELKAWFPMTSSLIPFSGISQFRQERIVPWGWNPALRKKLLDAGASEENLPPMEALKRLRTYSGRQNAVKMLGELKELRDDFCGESHYFSAIEDVVSFLSSITGNKVLKMPNSGSGKGLVWILGEITDKQTHWAKRVIRQQGGLVAEPVLTKVHDFAMEFYAENGNVVFSGYSLFNSAHSGAYAGNTLLSDIEIEETLSRYISRETLHGIKAFYLQKLAGYFPHYNGYIGVDMMICQTEKELQIQPCVEINMRMNMGMVAHIFYNRFVHAGSTGRFTVDFFSKQGDAARFYQKMKSEQPLLVENGRIVSGFLSLTPIDEETQYVAWAAFDLKL